MTGKACVAPTKLTTIPRLELTAAVVSVTVSNMLREQLGCANAKAYFWTDSKVVLSYINNNAFIHSSLTGSRRSAIAQPPSNGIMCPPIRILQTEQPAEEQ